MCFTWQKFLPGRFEWSNGSKTAFLPIHVFGCVVTLRFGLQFFRNAIHFPRKSFPLTKFATFYIWIELWSKTFIVLILGHEMNLAFDLWTLYFQKCLTLDQEVFSIDKSCHPVHLNGVIAPKMSFCPYIGHVVTLTFETQNVISLIFNVIVDTVNSTQFEGIPFMHSGVMALTRFEQTNGRMNRQTTQKPLKKTEA